MNHDRLTDELAVNAMGWRTAKDRFLKRDREWIPRWRFQPFCELSSAFELLDHVTDRYTITCVRRTFHVEVRISTRGTKSSGQHLAPTISTAVAEAFGLKVKA